MFFLLPYFKGLHYAASFSKPGFSYTRLYFSNDLERDECAELAVHFIALCSVTCNLVPSYYNAPWLVTWYSNKIHGILLLILFCSAAARRKAASSSKYTIILDIQLISGRH